MGYKEDIRIDIDHLDKEWTKQAALYQNYARQEAITLYDRDQLNDNLALTQAQLDGDIRLSPTKYGFDSKPTEAAILNTIKQQPQYLKANKLLMKAACKAKIIGGAVRSFDHKKKALEKLTELYLSGYWAAPKIRSEAQEVFGKQTKEELDAALKKEGRLVTASLKKETEKAALAATKLKEQAKARAGSKPKPKTKPKAETKIKSPEEPGVKGSKAGVKLRSKLATKSKDKPEQQHKPPPTPKPPKKKK